MTTLLTPLFVSLKAKLGDLHPDLPQAFRQIELWANRQQATVSAGYASLTGPGQTVTPGDLTQAGGFTVNSTTSIQLNDNGGGISINEAANSISMSMGSNGSSSNVTIYTTGASSEIRLQSGDRIRETSVNGHSIVDSSAYPGAKGGIIIYAGGSASFPLNNPGEIDIQGLQAVSVTAGTSGLALSCPHGGPITLSTGGLGGGVAVGTTGDPVGFCGAAPIGSVTITGSRGGNVALANLLTALGNFGLITDSTTP